MNLGIAILLVAGLGYASNVLNWRYLNYGAIRFLYYVGACVHETSHAVLCVVTGAKIEQFTVFSRQPRVVHRKSKIPFLGELLISAAPIAGGLLFLFLVNRYLLNGYFSVVTPSFGGWRDWRALFVFPLGLIAQIDLLRWQSWVMVALFFNVGAMLGPSPQDLKNVWPMLAILLLVPPLPSLQFLVAIGLTASGLIMANIILQAVVIVVVKSGAALLGHRARPL